MLGVATGLAEAGFVPFAYSIATFASMRGYEFLRNGPALHELPVRIVGMGAGLDYGHNGVTHYALEDVAIMRVQPSVATVAPADGAQARQALRATRSFPQPIYFRLCKQAEMVPGLDGRFALGDLELIGEGTDVALIALGNMAPICVQAAKHLETEGISSTVAIVSSFNPSPWAGLADLLRRVPLAVSVEAHYPNGGLGSFASEVIAEEGIDCRLMRRAVTEMPRGQTGAAAYLYDQYGLSAPQIARAAQSALQAVQS
jgi:transketolase